QMVDDLNLDVKIVTCPIVREPDGLAMASRNEYLSADERHAATALYRALGVMKDEIDAGQRETTRLKEAIRQEFDREPRAALDYAEIVDAATFEPVVLLRGTCLALVAAFVGKTRLIDNALIEDSGDSISVIL
ncbi:MAG TPA: pantoate--beta-alanine ligase, partial [Candidatus Acidoferrales bacterium]|nr:pantoate--beta-alanine ligase [Candidatus Acidoferrales bacterium]